MCWDTVLQVKVLLSFNHFIFRNPNAHLCQVLSLKNTSQKSDVKPQVILRCVCQTKQNRTMYTLKPANEQHTLQWRAAKTPVQDFCFPATVGDVKTPEQSAVQQLPESQAGLELQPGKDGASWIRDEIAPNTVSFKESKQEFKSRWPPSDLCARIL